MKFGPFALPSRTLAAMICCASLIVRDVRAKVTVTHLGGPDFIIQGDSNVVYVDPLPPNAANFIRHFAAFRSENNPVPDLVLITHNHGDHLSIPAIQLLLKLNPRLRVIAPLDSHDALDAVMPPDQLLTPAPKPGQPARLSHQNVTTTVYRTLHGWLTDDLVPTPVRLSGSSEFGVC